ncbi:hypothetical protein SAMN05216464_107185 [Mucilaginibacter pineti]|uniref:Knr4/Smi1-like domain-containing protein n=1 Tax=Mucilaginibacter pineti TaxID=1391627 RepID=A0A1G7DY40_9SPHI|nr:SMI1/KNR4 family protein [Mucilaginibacter pineti]SDE56383.1 hypothetical protein SAMN05216464_107185 [Mucilaginibacter pineti]
MLITDTIHTLQNLPHNGLTLHMGAKAGLISECEATYGITLPDDFKAFYSFSDGLEVDEDIFNIIPLTEIIENKDRRKKAPLYIAEYMIYIDMWQLEINPDDCNDYKIIIEANGNKLVLTNSLSEFIDRVLKGNVFEPGGLYDWQLEVEKQPIYSTKPSTAKYILTVFYYALRYGLISRKEVVEWSDQIIQHENEPESFFIDLSLSHDKNELISWLNSVRVEEDSTVARAILGLLYHRLSAGIITTAEAITVIEKHGFSDRLTNTEHKYIDDFADKAWLDTSAIDDIGLIQKVWDFLAHYKEFEIANYKHWYGFSVGISYKFEGSEKKSTSEYPTHKNKPKIKLWMADAVFYTLFAVSFIITLTTYNEEKHHVWIFLICYLLFKSRKWFVKKLTGVAVRY